MPYHISAMDRLLRVRPGAGACGRTVRDLEADEEREEEREDRVDPAEAEQGEERRPRVNGRARALGGPKEAIDEPRLTAELRREPARENARCTGTGMRS